MAAKTLSQSKLRDASTYSSNAAASVTAGRLFSTGKYVPQKMPMKLIRPMSDSDVGSNISYDHRGYVGIQQVVKITVQGGAFPFFLENVSLPAGATVGQTIFDADYMVIKFTPASTGTYTFSFSVIDQNKTKIYHTHTVTVDATWVNFIAPGGNDTTGTGTYANPWQTIAKAQASITGGKALCFKNGTYALGAYRNNLIKTGINCLFAENFGQVNVDASTIPAPGVDDGNPYPCWYWNDKFTGVLGIKFINPPTTVPSPRWFSSDKDCSYSYMDNCVFDINNKVGTSNSDNVSCFFLGDSGGSPSRAYIAQTRCDFVGFAGVANGWSAIDCYGTENLVIEENTFHGQVSSSATAGVIWIKGAKNKNITIRRNETTDTWSGSVVDIYLGNIAATDNITGNIEVCYNKLRGNNNFDDALLQVARASQTGIRLPVWSYRNTVSGRYFINNRAFAVNFTSENDVVIHNHTNADPYKIYVYDSNDAQNVYRPISYMATLTASITGYEVHKLPSDNAIDASLNLQGAYRTSYLGTRGAEVSL